MTNALPLDVMNVQMVNEIPLAVVAIEPLPKIGVVRDILREALADHEADEGFRTLRLHAVRHAIQRTADEVSGADGMSLRANRGRALTR